ncbi:hypothetical protein BGCPKDLD_2975 [Methylorubrum suomiense]|uniref:Uncharacterized protein n=1 Tax=Methylorubrum suomiense TaxID=144191 RepID=A0ABQ4UVN8_9HYPH|nr:hypothetical protein BGCPKDLD_2975 [Methylorubrum suomiense]
MSERGRTGNRLERLKSFRNRLLRGLLQASNVLVGLQGGFSPTRGNYRTTLLTNGRPSCCAAVSVDVRPPNPSRALRLSQQLQGQPSLLRRREFGLGGTEEGRGFLEALRIAAVQPGIRQYIAKLGDA